MQNNKHQKRKGCALRIQAIYTKTSQTHLKQRKTTQTKQSKVNHNKEYLGKSTWRGNPTPKNPLSTQKESERRDPLNPSKRVLHL